MAPGPFLAALVALPLLGIGQTDARDLHQIGTASWYGGKYDGRPTASGEIFDSSQLTAAHPSLPFGTQVQVLNPANGRSVVVRINDRGPGHGRVIDLSMQAAKALDIVRTGTARVHISTVRDAVAAVGD
jgi:rare lipoprotein A